MIALYIHNSLIHWLVMRSTFNGDRNLITVPVKNPWTEILNVRIKTLYSHSGEREKQDTKTR